MRERAEASSSGGGLGKGRRLCEPREKEREQGVLEVRKTCVFGEWGSRTGKERQISGEGETAVGEKPFSKTPKLVGWGAAQECWGHGQSSAQFSLPKITFESPYKI